MKSLNEHSQKVVSSVLAAVEESRRRMGGYTPEHLKELEQEGRRLVKEGRAEKKRG